MFKKKIFNKNVAVHCDTEAKDLALRTYAHSKGYKWCNGNSFLDKSEFYSVGDDYCLLIVNGNFGTLNKLKTKNYYKVISFEKAFKKGYEWDEKLGKVVFPASEKQEVKQEVKEEIKYPIFAKGKDDVLVVKFTASETGEVVLSPSNSEVILNIVYGSFVSHTDKDVWQILDYNEERSLYDTQPVIVWDDDMKADKSLRFYDAVNDGTFSFSGKRNGSNWSKMKPLTKEQLIAFKDEIEEMYKNLKV
jgi:hypothetical protein